jgi:hypothetical protein
VAVPLESPPATATPALNPKHASVQSSLYTSETDVRSTYSDEPDADLRDSPLSSVAPSLVPSKTVSLLDHNHSLVEDADTLTFSPAPAAAPSPAAFSPAGFGSPVPSAFSPTYPPRAADPSRQSTLSMLSNSTESSRKARPESMIAGPAGPLVLGLALVDFNHIVGPRIEFSRGAICDDDEVAKILPFLALPDGAHLVRPALRAPCAHPR